jgi:phosphatidate cytidylyltransferase
MLRARVTVAAIGLPLLAAVVIAPELVFRILVALLFAAATFELMRVAVPAVGRVYGLLGGVIVAMVVVAPPVEERFLIRILILLTAAAVVQLLSTLLRWPREMIWFVLGLLYVAVPGGHWVLLRDLTDGVEWVAVAIVATFATDTGAYTAGRTLGRHKLSPTLSPNKTWEGAAGGVLVGAAGSIITMQLLGLDPGVALVVAVALGLPVAAIAGDLLESAIKRRIGVKDMSQLLPGHGGLLDRLDSLLLTGPLLYWLVRWLPT